MNASQNNNEERKYKSELGSLDSKAQEVERNARKVANGYGAYAPTGAETKGILGYAAHHLQSKIVRYGIATLLAFYLGATQGPKVESAYSSMKKFMHTVTSPVEAATKEVVGKTVDRSIDFVVDQFTKLDPSKLTDAQLQKIMVYASNRGLVSRMSKIYTTSGAGSNAEENTVKESGSIKKSDDANYSEKEEQKRTNKLKENNKPNESDGGK